MYTKGNWKIIHEKGDYSEYDYDIFIGVEKPRYTQHVAQIMGWGGHYQNDMEMQANSHLISAAPDLLEACKQALLWIKASEPDYNQESPLIKQLEKAISKAEGAKNT